MIRETTSVSSPLLFITISPDVQYKLKLTIAPA